MSPEERAHAVVRPWTNIAAWRRRHLIEDIAAAIRAAVARSPVRKVSLHAQRGQAASKAALCSAIALAVTGARSSRTGRSAAGG